MRKHKTQSNAENDRKIIELYATGKTTHEVGMFFGCAQSHVRTVLQRHNFPIRTAHTRKYNVHEDFFDTIDTEEKAYFLGFMYADGNNYVQGNHSYEVSINLQASDTYILERFRDLIAPDLPLKLVIIENKHWQNQCRFKINSKKLSERLSALGCIPNKSLKLTFPDFIEERPLHHFIRGYNDGDGSVAARKPSRTGYINYGMSFTSTKNFCDVARLKMEKLLSVHFTTGLCHPKTNQITTRISIGGNLQVMKVLDWLYHDATVYLPRKYETYLEFQQFVKVYEHASHNSYKYGNR